MQLKKRSRRIAANTFPCSICGKEHSTSQHYKSDEDRSKDLISRRNNPTDKMFVPKEAR